MSACLFCRIAAGELQAEIVYEDERAVAFRDIRPQAPVHVLVIPREHIASLDEVRDNQAGLLAHLLLVVQQVAAREKIAGGYRVVNNCGPAAGQSVFHVHFHVLGGRTFGWPPG